FSLHDALPICYVFLCNLFNIFNILGYKTGIIGKNIISRQLKGFAQNAADSIVKLGFKSSFYSFNIAIGNAIFFEKSKRFKNSFFNIVEINTIVGRNSYLEIASQFA